MLRCSSVRFIGLQHGDWCVAVTDCWRFALLACFGGRNRAGAEFCRAIGAETVWFRRYCNHFRGVVVAIDLPCVSGSARGVPSRHANQHCGGCVSYTCCGREIGGCLNRPGLVRPGAILVEAVKSSGQCLC